MSKNPFVLFVSFTILTTTAVSVVVSAELDPIKLQLINQLIETYFIPSNQVTGLSISIVQNNETVLSKGYGFQSIEAGIPVSNRTLFSIGSISKSFGATLIVKILHERFGHLGEHVLDTPIVKLAPGYNFTLSDRFRGQYATFRDLLSHRICLFSPDLELLFGSVSRAEYSFRTRYQTETCTVRNGFQYNNALYALVGELIAHIAGNATIEQLTMEFMHSIGMAEATYFDLEESYLDLPTMSSSYFRKDNQTYLFNNTLLRRVHIGLTAGGILASSNDMAQYTLFHLNRGKVGSVQIIPEEVMNWIYKVSNPIDFNGGKQDPDDIVAGTYGYGLGFDIQLYDGFKAVGHGGYWPPFHSYLSFIHARNVGIFTSTNGPGALLYGLYHEGLHSAIYDILAAEVNQLSELSIQKYYKVQQKLGVTSRLIHMELPYLHKSTSADKQILDDLRNQRGLKVTPSSLQDLLGLYGNANSGDLTITPLSDDPDSGDLQLNFGEWAIGRLFSASENDTTFQVEWLTDIDHHYLTYGDGLPAPVVAVDFSIEDTAVLVFDNEVFVPFVKNRTLDMEPVVPWPPGSCGPIELDVLH